MKKLITLAIILLTCGCVTTKHSNECWVVTYVHPDYTEYACYKYIVHVRSLKDGTIKSIEMNLPTCKEGDTLRNIE